MDYHTQDEIAAFAQRMRDHGVSTVFAYVSYLKRDGLFNQTYGHAATFARQFRSAAPDVSLLAWIGVPMTFDSGWVSITRTDRLADPDIRERIALFARQTIDMGFDGVHMDAEPVVDGDAAYLEALDLIRARMPPGALLSVAAPALYPYEPVTLVPYPRLATHWTREYLRLVGQRCDQVAVMAYDSGLFLPSDYRAWMALQVRGASEALAGLPIEVLIGLPTSEEWTLSHNIAAEYLANAIFGARLGLIQARIPGTIDGIAVYPDWETDDAEWRRIDDFDK
jgi:hypothetical protein